MDGIILDNSSNNEIIENNASLNAGCGIGLYSSNNNTIIDNTANSNYMDGIHLSYSSNNTITGNNMSSNNCGIYVYHSSNNTVIDNSAKSNTRSTKQRGATWYWRDWKERYYTTSRSSGTCSEHYGIFIGESNNNKLSNNSISNNEYGILLLYSYNPHSAL